jgi:hypothetical protein
LHHRNVGEHDGHQPRQATLAWYDVALRGLHEVVPVPFARDLTSSPAEWRKWAAEAKATAAIFKDGDAKCRMIALADIYEQLAVRAEAKP